jgi:hypothetical protein
VLAAGQFNPADLLTTFALVLAASKVFYARLWKPKGVTASIESATNLSARTPGV